MSLHGFFFFDGSGKNTREKSPLTRFLLFFYKGGGWGEGVGIFFSFISPNFCLSTQCYHIYIYIGKYLFFFSFPPSQSTFLYSPVLKEPIFFLFFFGKPVRAGTYAFLNPALLDPAPGAQGGFLIW